MRKCPLYKFATKKSDFEPVYFFCKYSSQEICPALYQLKAAFFLPLFRLQCPPCKKFTPELAKFYGKAKESGKKFEVVFVTSDNSEEEFKDYLTTMPWWAIAYEDKTKSALSKKFEIEGMHKCSYK